MIMSNESIEGLRLVLVLSEEEFYYFPLPKSLQELKQIEDRFISKGQLEFICQQISGNCDYIYLKNYNDYQEALITCGTAQGLVAHLKITKIPFSQDQWRCKYCTANNQGGDKCSVCQKLRHVVNSVKNF